MYFSTSAGFSSICGSLQFYWLISFFCLFFNVSWIFLHVLPSLQFHWSSSFSGLLVYVLFAALQFHWLISFVCLFLNVSWISFNVLLFCNFMALSLVDLFCLFCFQRQLDFLQFITAPQFRWLIFFFWFIFQSTPVGFPSIPAESAIPLADLFLFCLLDYLLFVTLQFHWLISLFCLLSNVRWIFSALQFHWLSPTCLLSFATFCLFSDEGNTINIDIPRFSCASSCPISCDLVHARTYLLINKAATKQNNDKLAWSVCFWDRFNGQEMLLAVNFDGRSTKEKIMDAISTIT